jgi:hypothetical protein
MFDTTMYVMSRERICLLFYVVPVSEGHAFRMHDGAAKAAGLNGTNWYNQLASKFDESAGKGGPMVVVFTNTVSGSGEFLDAYKMYRVGNKIIESSVSPPCASRVSVVNGS